MQRWLFRGYCFKNSFILFDSNNWSKFYRILNNLNLDLTSVTVKNIFCIMMLNGGDFFRDFT